MATARNAAKFFLIQMAGRCIQLGVSQFSQFVTGDAHDDRLHQARERPSGRRAQDRRNPLAATVNPHAPAAPKSDICDGHHISEVSQPGCDRHGPRPDPQVASLCRIGPRRANRKPAGSLNGPRPRLALWKALPRAALMNWPPFRPDTRHNLEGLRLSSSTGLCLTTTNVSN